jgi:hypothetical protein
MSGYRISIAVILVFWARIAFAGQLLQAPAAIQISSKISDGQYSIPEIIKICRSQKIKVIIICDRDLMRWEYGVGPLRNILKKKVEDSSILKYGARRYWDEFNKIKNDNPDLVVIPGVESAPFYYWNGDLFQSNLEIRDWHKHLISIGLNEAKDLEYLPVIGNKKALQLPFNLKNLIFFWPISLLAAGFLYLKKRVCDYKDQSGKQLGPGSKKDQKLGILLIAVALLLLADNFPFTFYRFDQYHGSSGIKPYQEYIDYVKERNGLVFWAHPEARNVDKDSQVSIRTEDHSFDLLQSKGYSGFGIFFEGFKTVGKINGIWDSLLKEYCAGIRKDPVWATGFLSFDSTGKLEDSLKALKTVLLLPKINDQEVLKALKNGKMYSALGSDSSGFVLNDFTVSDPQSKEEKIMGEWLNTAGAPLVRIKADFLNGQPRLFKIKLIRNGEVINDFETLAPADITFLDAQAPATGNFYYRLEIHGPQLEAVTNPIFIRRIKEQ